MRNEKVSSERLSRRRVSGETDSLEIGGDEEKKVEISGGRTSL